MPETDVAAELEKEQVVVVEYKARLHDLPEEMMLEMVGFLGFSDQYNLCVACSRTIPLMWFSVLISYSTSLKHVQMETEEFGILTEIASESQINAQNEWCTVT
jgi:hypothetical protein